MPKSLDLIKQEREELGTRLSAAMAANDDKAFAEAVAQFAESVEQHVIDTVSALSAEQSNDAAILAARGVRQLTSAEQKFYKDVIGALSGSDPKQALSNLEVGMPETILDAVFEDMEQEHPLLGLIDFTHTNGKVKVIINKTGICLAVWGKITDEYKTELEGAIDEIDAGMFKLQAFIPVPKSMLDLGPKWIDRYVRLLLSESTAFAMEKSIIRGTGKDEPIGMDKIVGKDKVVTEDGYKAKTPIPVTSFDPVSYGDLASKLATNAESGRKRAVTRLALICSPVDYLKKIMPATTFLTPQGSYVNNVFPIPTDTCQSQECEEGKAILGLAKRYKFVIGQNSKDGKIEIDDSVRFFEDQRVFAVRFYGNGMPMDNNAFQVLDITGLEPIRFPVSTLAESLDSADDEP